jgi:hypothetical protein
VARKRRRTHADCVTGSHRTLGSEIFIRERERERERERARDVLVKEKFTQFRRERVRRYGGIQRLEKLSV